MARRMSPEYRREIFKKKPLLNPYYGASPSPTPTQYASTKERRKESISASPVPAFNLNIMTTRGNQVKQPATQANCLSILQHTSAPPEDQETSLDPQDHTYLKQMQQRDIALEAMFYSYKKSVALFKNEHKLSLDRMTKGGVMPYMADVSNYAWDLDIFNASIKFDAMKSYHDLELLSVEQLQKMNGVVRHIDQAILMMKTLNDQHDNLCNFLKNVSLREL